MQKYEIDEEFKSLLPPLTDEEYSQLKKSIEERGYDHSLPIVVWKGYIVDGHSRYKICNELKINFTVRALQYGSKEEVKRWILEQQLTRRNLNKFGKIMVAEKLRPIYEKLAKENKSANGGNKKANLENSTTPMNPEQKIDVREKLAAIAGVSTNTYDRGVKILRSGNEKLIEAVRTGEMTINAAYTKLQRKEPKRDTGTVSTFKKEITESHKNFMRAIKKANDHVT